MITIEPGYVVSDGNAKSGNYGDRKDRPAFTEAAAQRYAEFMNENYPNARPWEPSSIGDVNFTGDWLLPFPDAIVS